MSDQRFVTQFNLPGLDLYENPLYYGYEQTVMANDGKIIRSVNLNSIPLGGKTVREGYQTFLGTTQNQGSQVNTLFQWIPNFGTNSWLYCFAGSTLSYYDVSAGTATDWIVCGNGTFTGTHVGHTVLNNTLIAGDSVGSTRHTTNGTSFTNTTLAPSGEFFEQYQNRVYIAGTDSNLFYSVANDPTNWQLGGTSDSTSIVIPGAGRINKVFVISDLLYVTKTGKNMYRWDGNALQNMSTGMAPTSPYSYGTIEDSGFYINQTGVTMVDQNGPQLISNPITRYFYNQNATGIAGTSWGTAPAGVKRYDYYVAVGSVRDDLTDEPLNNAVIKYNAQKNEWLTYQYADAPTAFTDYIDKSGSIQFLFGNSSGQVFQTSDTLKSDNGAPINSVLDLIFTANTPQFEKDWRWFWGFFNPGCEAQVQVALGNTFTKGQKNWIDIGQALNGIIQYRFPTGSRSRLLYVRVKDSSRTQGFTCFGFSLSYVPKDPG